MSDSQEPTMEEILASIRRIISEDDTEQSPAPAAAAPPPAEEPAEVEAPPAVVEEEPMALEDEELELTDKVDSHGDLDVYTADEGPEVGGADAETAGMGNLVSGAAAAAAAAAFGRLSGNMAMPAAGRTLEDVVRELLRPLLQQWVDENLPGIVQRAVDAEVSRIARGG
jgi:cell pole-organizing protein PopZ